MTDILETGEAWLTEQNIAHRGRTVAYSRGDTSASVTAVLGRSMLRAPGEFGTYQEIEHNDFLIQVADLAAFDEPEPGDRVTVTLNDNAEIFEVMAPLDVPVFDYSDSYRMLYRIHTKRVGRSE